MKTVVLPDPFGPIRPVTVPPLDRERAVVDGRDAAEALAQPGDLEQRAHEATTSFARDSWPRAVPAHPIVQRRKDAAREQEHDTEENPRVADEVELARPEPVGEVLLRGNEDERADDRAPDGGLPAQVDHQHHADRDERVDGELRVDEGDVVSPDPAGHGDEARRQRERGELDEGRLHAEPAGAILVVADGCER